MFQSLSISFMLDSDTESARPKYCRYINIAPHANESHYSAVRDYFIPHPIPHNRNVLCVNGIFLKSEG